MFQYLSLRLIKPASVFILFFYANVSFSQPLNQAAANAFIITSMAAKFHVQPRNLNDSLSADFFNQLLQQLDEEHIYFIKDDIVQLTVYKFQLDDEIKQKKNDFLKLIAGIYAKRLQQADTMIDAITQKHFNYSVSEKFAVAEDTSYPADIVSMHNKLYKKIKIDVLSDLLELNDNLSSKNSARQTEPITYLGLFLLEIRVLVTREPQPPPAKASVKPPTAANLPAPFILSCAILFLKAFRIM